MTISRLFSQPYREDRNGAGLYLDPDRGRQGRRGGRAIGALPGIVQADDVTGPYDVIVKAEAQNVDDLGRLVATDIQSVPGITRTLTCPIVHL